MRIRTALLLGAAFAAAACGDDGPTDNNGDTTGDIVVDNNVFQPAAFSGTVGDEVLWVWADGAVTHNVTFDDGPSSPNQSSGTYTRTFTAAGTYPYHCTIHGSAMSGTVVVAAEGGSTGDGGGGGGGAGGGNTGGDTY